MKKGIRKTISIIAILTMTFQMGMPMIPELTSKVFATDMTIPVETEKIQATVGEEGTTELTESADTIETEEISRNYEIKDEETWDVSKNGDGSVIAKWTLDNKTLTISGTGEMQNWEQSSKEDWHDTQYTNVIENVIIENGITNIGSYVFYNCRSLTNITILEGVTSIGRDAFYGCSSLTSINIPSSVTSIGDDAFYRCSSLTSIEIPEGVTIIADSVFEECSSLTDIIIPEGVTSIERYAFSGCSSLKSINIPEGVTSIEVRAFNKCSSLTNIEIPEGVTSIESNPFYGCSSLTSINVDTKNNNYISENGILLDKEKSKIIKYPAGKKNSEEYNIPSTVTIIEESAFEGCSSLVSINIPSSVTSIGEDAFSRCSGLTSIEIPERVTSIENSAFLGCSSLTGINMSSSVTNIGSNAFEGCSSLTNIEIPEGVKNIGSSAFKGCSNLTSITIPEGVTSIGWYTFEGCSSLTSINISNSVTIIGIGAFEGCSSLTDITISEGVTSIENRAFLGCSSLTDITIPKGVTSIGDNAFSECTSLESINILEGVTSIGRGVFYGCSSLTSIEIPEGVTSIGYSAFDGCTNLESINIPESVINIKIGDIPKTIKIYVKADSEGHRFMEENKIGYILENEEEIETTTNFEIKEEETWDISANGDGSVIAKWILSDKTLTISGTGKIKDWRYSNPTEDWHASQYTNLIQRVIIEEGVTYIGNYAFEECSSLISIEIPEGVTSIGEWAFSRCSSLTNIEIPEGVTSIGECAFYGCSILTDITIPKGVTSIEYGTFSRCTSLTSIEIPEGVTSIGNNAFNECSSLTSMEIPESVASIGRYVFSRCSSLESINVDVNNINYISENGVIFNKEKTKIIRYPEGKKNLKEYTIPSTVTTLEWCAFEGCSLENIKLSEGVKSIGVYAFLRCDNLKSMNIPEGVKSIEDYAFKECSSLTSIEISEGVTSIGRDAFYGCSSLTSINIPEGVTNIEGNTFSGCSSLTSINIPEGVTSIKDGAFSGCSNLKSITIPEGVTRIGYSTFYGCTSLISINIPSTVKSIGNNAFEKCSSLTSIIIPSSVVDIENPTIPVTTIIYIKSNSEGHRYAEESGQGYIIDDIAPTVIFTPSIGENVQKEHSVKIQVQDNMEEVGVNENSLKYQWTQSDTEPTKESFTESFENGQTIMKNTGDGLWYLWVYTKDNLDNEIITRSEGFNFDNTAPVLNVTYSTKNSTKENVKVTITSNEEIQAVQGWELSSDKKTLTKEYSANTKETITVKDLAGNEAQSNVEISNIDKTAPTVNVSYSTKDLTKENVTVTITSNEELQNIEGWNLSSDKKTLTKEYTENAKETVTIKDLAGNETQVSIEITNIDKTLPDITIGDINQDGKIDVTDLLMLKRHLVAGNRSNWKLTGDSLLAADMNENGTVDITDMLMLKRVIVEKM